MFRVQRIDSLEDPQLAPYRTMRWQMEHRRQQIFVAEGAKVVCRLLESRFPVVSVLIPPKWVAELEPLLRARPADEDISVFVAEKGVLEELTGFSMYQGVTAVGRIPPLPALADVLRMKAAPLLFAAIDGLSNAENVGGLVRNCVAFGAQALIVGETSSSPFLRRAVRSSMGTVFQLPIVEVTSLADSLRELRAHGIYCVAAHPHDERHLLYDTNLGGPTCLVFGSEGHGISAAVRQACDVSVAVPMHSGVDSLNVGSASAVFLYEASRRRRGARPRS